MAYELDLKCNLSANRVHETVALTNTGPYRHYVVPKYGPFYMTTGSLWSVYFTPTGGVKTLLVEGYDYHFMVPFISASRSTGRLVYSALRLRDKYVEGIVTLTYHTIGGDYVGYSTLVDTAIRAAARIALLKFDDILPNLPQVPVTHLRVEDMTLEPYSKVLDRLSFIPAAITYVPTNNGTLKPPEVAPSAKYKPRYKAVYHLTDNTNPHQLSLKTFGLKMAKDEDAEAMKKTSGIISLGQLRMVIEAVLAANPDVLIPPVIPNLVIPPVPPSALDPNVDVPAITLVKAQYTSSAKDKVNINLSSSTPSGLITGDTMSTTVWSGIETGSKTTLAITNAGAVYTLSLTDVAKFDNGWTFQVKYLTTEGAYATSVPFTVLLSQVEDAAVVITVSVPVLLITGYNSGTITMLITATVPASTADYNCVGVLRIYKYIEGTGFPQPDIPLTATEVKDGTYRSLSYGISNTDVVQFDAKLIYTDSQNNDHIGTLCNKVRLGDPDSSD